MKIISSFKDYYDFMVKKYGVDNKIVYNRVPEEKQSSGWWGKTGMYKPHHLDFPNDMKDYTIDFCGKMYVVYYLFGDWFFGEGILDAKPERYPEEVPDTYFYGYRNYASTRYTASIIKHWQSGYNKKKKGRGWVLNIDPIEVHGSSTKRNDELKCPVVLGDHKNIRLSDFNFGKIMPPDEAFVTISNWLSREKEVIDRQTDKEKMVSHGFDLKTSFRKM